MSYSLSTDGFELISSVLDRDEVETLRSDLASLKIAPGIAI